MDRDRAPQDPGADHHNVTITVATHMSSFARPTAGGCARQEISLGGRWRPRTGDRPPEEVVVRPYREPAAAVMLEMTGRRPG
jgi:hypothetical protein